MNTRTIAISRQGTRMLRRCERMGFLSSKPGDCLEARPAIPRLHLVVVGARSPGRLISIGGTNVNESSLQFYVTMPIRVI
jgi:hypothetical protein